MATWDQVKEEASKMQQMGFQAVQQAAKVGQMLIELKAETPHGEWDSNRQRAAVFNERQCRNLMTLARNIELLEEKQPESQRQALAIIKEMNPKQVTKKKGLRELGIDYGLLMPCSASKATNEFRQAVAQELGYELPSSRINALPDEQHERVELAVRSVAEKRGLLNLESQYKEHRQEVATLAETAQQKFDRLAARETQLLREMFKAEVRREFERTLPDRLKELEEREKRATDEIKKYQAMRNGVKAQISVEDYRFLLGVLHPDRAPEGMSERYAKAFNIVRKLDSYIQAIA